MKVTAQIKSTGELLELPADTAAEIHAAWQIASEYEKAAKALKDQLKPAIEKLLNDRGQSEPLDGYMFRQSIVQRMNYDKIILREVFDEDTLDLMLVPSKTDIDKYLKEHLAELGDGSTRLRQSMVPVGNPYSVLRREKLTRDA